MVLQRWQTVFLLIALILTAVFILTPIATVDGQGMPMITWPAYLVFNIVIGVLLLIDMFMYKKLPAQIRLCTMIIVLEVASIVNWLVMYFRIEGFEASWTGVAFMAVALICTIFGRRFMVKDRDLLASADRLR